MKATKYFYLIITICLLIYSCKKNKTINKLPKFKSIELIYGDNQIGLSETTLDEPITVCAKDEDGRPLKDIPLEIDIKEGSVSSNNITTGNDGKASFSWTLGQTLGIQDIKISLSDIHEVTETSVSEIKFTAISRKPYSNYKYKILFIGHSYFSFSDLPSLIKDLSNIFGKEVYIDSHIRGNTSLSEHDRDFEVEKKINSLNWDYVILIDSSSKIAYPGEFSETPYYTGLSNLCSKIKKNYESSKPVLCMSWAYENGMIGYKDWTDTFEDMQKEIYKNTLYYSNRLNITVSPVGWTWYKVLEEKNYPLHYLHLSDQSHPSLKGSLLMAYTVFLSIFQEDLTNISYESGIDKDEAILFKKVASDIVLKNLNLWNIK